MDLLSEGGVGMENLKKCSFLGMGTLKKCPFCGGEAKYIELKEPFATMFVACTVCGIETKRNYLNRNDAIKAWNTRKPMERIVERLNDEDMTAVDVANMQFDRYYDGIVEGIEQAIEIVKEELS